MVALLELRLVDVEAVGDFLVVVEAAASVEAAAVDEAAGMVAAIAFAGKVASYIGKEMTSVVVMSWLVLPWKVAVMVSLTIVAVASS